VSSPGSPWAGGPWEPFPLFEPYPPPPLPSPWRGSRLNIVFFFLTVLSVFFVGWELYGLGLWGGVRLVAATMSILMAHEMGHYVACRYYRVDATLPYFIPFPLHLVGTFGAFIRIRGRFPHRKALFDIGIAGPLAGFVVCLPVAVLGLMEAHVEPTQPSMGASFGEPLLFQWLVAAVIGPVADGQTVVIGPVGVAAWFGLFLTALNLMPIGQLDGGHVIYALWGRQSIWVSRLALAALAGLAFFQPSWVVWATLLLVLMRRPHPPTVDDRAPVGRGRALVGLLGLAVFVVCFTPITFDRSWSDFFSWLTSR
jgi:membrane-associated protease RseP (regulator of RpoE activity)